MNCIKDRCYSPVACRGFGYCRDKNLLFASEVKRIFGIEPAPFKKAIAMQRFEKGESVCDVIDALYQP